MARYGYVLPRRARRFRSPYGRRSGSAGPLAVIAAGIALAGAVAAKGGTAHPGAKARPAHVTTVTAAGPLMSTASVNVALGQSLASPYRWNAGPQWTCLDELWTRESGWRMVWNYQGSGAYGIAQALPASKMASAGADYMTNPATQIRWGLGYIQGRYVTPCGAWSHEEADSWY